MSRAGAPASRALAAAAEATAASPAATSPATASSAATSGTAAARSAAITALQAALAAEHAAVYGYGVAGAMLAGPAQAQARADWITHQEARDTLHSMITRLGATPVAASPAYQLPHPVTGAASARTLAATLEDGVTRAYLALVAVPDRTLRSWAAQAMQPPATRAARWRGTTQPFPGMPA